MLNITLVNPDLNRGQNGVRDTAGWLPVQNRCWLAERVIAVRRRYGLTIDRRDSVDRADHVPAWHGPDRTGDAHSLGVFVHAGKLVTGV